jgi:nicotinamide-nucleotide amidase
MVIKMEQDLITLSTKIGGFLTDQGLSISAAESCTGGLLSHVLTAVSGSSNYFIGGIVAYSNPIKEKFLGVKSETLVNFGAVSTQTAQEMADGIRRKFKTSIGLSTTGIAGPTGGTPEKPVGLVWIGISTSQRTKTYECHFQGGREQVQYSTVQKILSRLLEDLTYDPS